MKKILGIYDYIFAILLIGLPFSKALPNILLPLLGLLFLLNIRNVNFKPLLKPPVVLLYVLLVYIFIKGLVVQNIFTEWSHFKKYLIIFIIPILLLNLKNINIIKVSMVICVQLVIWVSITVITINFLTTGSLPFTNGEMVNQLLVMERPYAGFFAVLGFLFSFNLVNKHPRYKACLIASAVITVLFVLLIAARISFLTLIIMLGMYLLFYSKLPSNLRVFIIAGSVAIVVVLFIFNDNMAKRFFIEESWEESVAVASDYEPRLVIWPCAARMTEKPSFNLLTGFKTNKEIETNFINCYSGVIKNPSKKEYYLSEKFNSHNQFIDIALSQGLLGLLLFSGFLMSLWLHVHKNFFYTAILIAVVLFLLVENVLYRQAGCYIFSIFATIISINSYTYNVKNQGSTRS